MTGALTAIPKAASAPQAAAAQDALLRRIWLTPSNARLRSRSANQDLLQAQAAEIKRLSDAVAQLSTRVDGLSVRNAQAPVPQPRGRSRRPRKS